MELILEVSGKGTIRGKVGVVGECCAWLIEMGAVLVEGMQRDFQAWGMRCRENKKVNLAGVE